MAVNLFIFNFNLKAINVMKKNAYIHFSIKLILFLFIVFILDFTIGGVLRHYYFTQVSGRQYRATYAIDKTTDEVVVFGSSRAYHHYVPSIIEDSLHKTCYNTGSPGQFLLYNYATLLAILKRYSPKLIILDVSANDFSMNQESYDRLSFLLPYYKDHAEIRPIVDLKSSLEKYKLLSSIYAFNSSFLMIAGGNSSYFKKKSVDLKGYKPLDNIWTQSLETRDFGPYQLDSVKVATFKSFIKDCQHAGTQLFVVCSPSYIKYLQRDNSISLIEQIAKEYNTPFMDFTNDSTFINHKYLFDDPGHLNAKGAQLFTSILMNKFNDSMKIKSFTK